MGDAFLRVNVARNDGGSATVLLVDLDGDGAVELVFLCSDGALAVFPAVP